jgi:hypothetical protein
MPAIHLFLVDMLHFGPCSELCHQVPTTATALAGLLCGLSVLKFRTRSELCHEIVTLHSLTTINTTIIVGAGGRGISLCVLECDTSLYARE